MIKQSILVGAIALAAAGVASADGFYVGGQIGGTALHVKDTSNNAFNGSVVGAGALDGLTLTATSNSSSSMDAGNIGVQGGLLAGYGWTFPNQFYLGAEAFGNATSAKVSHNHSVTYNITDTTDNVSTGNETAATTANVKLRYNYGVRVLPGYAVTPDTTAYAILGYVRGNFRATSSDLGNATFNANGYQLGLGAMTNVAKNVAVRGDFVYSGYSSKTYTVSGRNTITTANYTATGTNSFSTKLKPSTMEANLAVVYKFG